MFRRCDASGDSPADDGAHSKVVVVGDAGVGKTTLVHVLAHGAAPRGDPPWTVGADVEVVPPQPQQRITRPVELWDVGGSLRFADTRAVFYDDVDGVILVHNLANPISLAHLPCVLCEGVCFFIPNLKHTGGGWPR